MKILLKISYVGTAYCGYQVQPNAVSVQQRLNEATKALFGFDCDIVGCSRTDSGVHANEFCATVAEKGTSSIQTEIPTERIPPALCAYLPSDICVYDAKQVSDDFHARYDVLKKEYIYRIYNRAVRNPFEEGRAFHVPKHVDEAGLLRMREAADSLLGTHDFSAYMAQGGKKIGTVRTVYTSSIERCGDVIVYRVAADGFLYNMVRILVGTLLEVGQGKRTVADVIATTESGDRTRAGMTVPACGLYLNRVFYKEEQLNGKA